MANVVGIPGEVHTETRTFSTVTLEAEHLTETHDPDPGNKSVDLIQLPGTVNLYVVIDGGRILLDQFRASDVLSAIDTAKAAGKSSDTPKTKTAG